MGGSKGNTVLNIAHFNDVYQVSDQKIHVNGKEETIDVTKFATVLSNVTAKWKDRPDSGKGKGKDGLIIFSGDLFSPSIESSITRGRHMPPIANGLGIDVGVAGNHEFDFGYPRLKELIHDTKFPWLLSNIVDTDTGKVPEPMAEIHVLERAGVRIGFIGLVEEEWIATITGWPENFKYKDMATVGKSLSAKLRDPAGEYNCDFIIALTHSRIPNDIKLAKALFALSPRAQESKNIAQEHGVDILLGGHDHIYWISKGVSEWKDYDLNTPQPDAKEDMGDVLVVKSGTDFQDLSEVVLVLKDTPAGSIRKKIIKDIKGQRHVTRGNIASNEDLSAIVDNELGTIKASMAEPICITDVQLDVRSSKIRLYESAIGNWIADCLRHAYDEALAKLGYPKTDGVIACTGDFRGDRVYEPGPFTLGDLMTVLPYPDPTVVVELTGNELWDTVESAVSHWPTQEGRFPALSGLRVEFDGEKSAGHRVKGIWLLADPKAGADGELVLVDKEEVTRKSTRKYLIMVGEYMWQGGDGYEVLKGKKLAIPAENGQSKSALVRKFLLGAQFMKNVDENPEVRKKLKPKTLSVLGGFEANLSKLLKVPSLADIKTPSIPSMPSIPSIPDNLPKMPKMKKPSIPSMPSFGSSSSGSLPKVKKPSIPSFGSSSSSSLPKIPTVKTPSMPSMPSFSTSSAYLPKMTSPSIPALPTFDLPDASDYIQSTQDYIQSTQDYVQSTAQRALDGVAPAIRWLASQFLFSAALAVAEYEDMGFLDSYERRRTRMTARLLRSSPDSINISLRMNLSIFLRSDDTPAEADEEDAKVDAAEEGAKKSLPVIHPVVDGRLKNISDDGSSKSEGGSDRSKDNDSGDEYDQSDHGSNKSDDDIDKSDDGRDKSDDDDNDSDGPIRPTPKEIKLVAFEVDNTIWKGILDERRFGKGPRAASKLADNLQLVGDDVIRDRREHSNSVTLYSDIPKIVHDIAKRGISLAIVSQNSSKALCDRALYYFKTKDKDGEQKSIISLVRYDEVGKVDKVDTFKKIHGWCKYSYDEMVFFDSDSTSKVVQDKLGVKFVQVKKDKGVELSDYQRAIEN